MLFYSNSKERNLAIALAGSVIIGYIVITAFFSFLRYTDFFTTNWDMGIAVQSFWTNTHGYLLYESGDYESYGVLSFLQVHSTYIAILFSYFYLIFPEVTTIFVLQSFFVSISIIPIYFICKKVNMPNYYFLAFSLLFLLNFSIISGLLYDFHWESLIPVEFFSLFVLLLNKKYSFAILVFIIGCLTLEIFPFILAGISLYFLLSKYMRGARQSGLYINIPNIILISLFLVAGISYLLIRIAQYFLIPILVGQIGQTAGVTGSVSTLFVLTLNPNNIEYSTLYWLILIASFALLPIFSPKLLIIAIPWIIYTFLIAIGFTNSFGNQDSFLTTPYVMLAAIGGMEKIRNSNYKRFYRFIIPSLIIISILFIIPVDGISASFGLISWRVPYIYYAGAILSILPVALLLSYLSRKRKVFSGHFVRYITIFFVSLIVFNLVLSPLNTENFQASPLPGYSFFYGENPEFNYAKDMSSMIPKNATVVASDNLFPMVANSRYAYSLTWLPYSDGIIVHFPFNETHKPQYIFVDESYYFLPNFLTMASTNSSEYGAIAYSYSASFPKTIALYELGFTGTPLLLGHRPPVTRIFDYNNLSLTADGSLRALNGSTYQKVITGKTGNSSTSLIWYGPYTTIAPGTYRMEISYQIDASNATSNNGSALELSVGVHNGITLTNTLLNYSAKYNNKWRSSVITFNVSSLILNAEFYGILISQKPYQDNITVYLNYIELQQIM
ncbi:MAG: DUF2079 domain-containing protein [Thermoplasmatales archaeon]